MKRFVFLFILLSVFKSVSCQTKEAQFDSIFKRATVLAHDYPTESLTEGLKAVAYADQSQYKPGLVSGTIFVCEHYIRLGNDARALSYAVKAEKECPLTDYFNRIKLKRIKGKCLIRLGFYDEADRTLKEALHIANKIKDAKLKTVKQGYIYADMALNYEENEETKNKVTDYYLKSLASFSSVDDTDIRKKQYLFFVLVKMASFYRREKQFTKAQAYLERAETVLPDFKQDMVTAEFFFSKGIFSCHENEYKKGGAYLKKSLRILKKEHKIVCKKQVYYELFKVYKKLNIPDSSRYYRQQYILYNDSLAQLHKKDVNAAFRFFEDEKQNEIRESFLLQLFIMILFVVMIILGSPKLFQYHQKFIATQKESRKVENLLLENTVHLEQLQKEDVIAEDKNEKLRRLAKEGSPVFLLEFKKNYKTFCDYLIERTPLINNDLKFCALIKLNFTTAEIANYTKSTIRAVESRKYRIRKKINIPQGKDFQEWLSEL